MDLFLLCGGYGTRLFGKYVKDDYLPKGLVDINGTPAIENSLKAVDLDLFDRIILETNCEGEEYYEHWIESSDEFSGFEVFVEKESTPVNPLGVLKTIEIVYKECNLKEPTLLLSPDNVFSKKQSAIVQEYSEGYLVGVYDVKDPSLATKYGVVTLQKGRIGSCVEKPMFPGSSLVRASFEIWESEVLSFLEEWNHIGSPDKVGDFINFLINKKQVIKPFVIDGFWIDIGSQENLELARKRLK